jgi:HK97 gp10 family phage protein
MITMRTTVTGIAELNKKLAKLADPATAQREMKLALLAGAKPIADRAQQLAPVLTGRLKRSIEIREIDADVQVRAAMPYAHLAEFGHRGGAKGRPFMRPGYYETKDEAIRIVRDHMAAAVAREAR